VDLWIYLSDSFIVFSWLSLKQQILRLFNYGIRNLLFRILYKLSCWFSFGTCLVIVLSVFIWYFLSEYSSSCRYLDPLIWISSQNKPHLHSSLPGFLLSLRFAKDVVKQSGKMTDFRNLLLQRGDSGRDTTFICEKYCKEVSSIFAEFFWLIYF